MREDDLNKQCEALQNSLVILVDNTQLAAALVAVGVSLREDPPYTHKIEGGRHIVTWHFRETSDDKKVMTLELVKAFKNDAQYIAANPNTPFTYALMAIKNYRSICDWMGTNPKSLAYNERERRNVALVDNPQLAAALLTVGVPLSKTLPWVSRNNGVIEWGFDAGHGDHSTLELIKAFKIEPEWTAQNPMNPFTFAMQAIKNLQNMTEWIRTKSKPFLVYRSPSGKHTAFVIQGSRREKKCIKNGFKQV